MPTDPNKLGLIERSSNQPNSSHFPLLDPLRGFAALWVFAFHCIRVGNPTVDAVFEKGYLGVPIFFVISGYCITAAAENSIRRNESTWVFLKRRLIRIYPTFWCSIGLIFALFAFPVVVRYLFEGEFSYHPKTWMAFSISKWLGIFTLAEIYSAKPKDLFPFGDFGSLNAVYWSLAIEVQFYVVMFLILLFRQKILHWALILSVLGTCLIFVPAVMYSGNFLPFWPMFAAGILLYYVRTSTNFSFRKHYLKSCAYALVCLVMGFAIEYAPTGKFQYNAVTTIATLALLVSATFFERSLPKLASRISASFFFKGAAAMGTISYSIYLTHVPFWNFFSHYFPVESNASRGHLLSLLMLSSLTLVAVVAFYFLFERSVLLFLHPKKRSSVHIESPIGTSTNRGSN